jgi:3-oxoacyl-[acyl-carrier protein] reductase
MGMLDGRVALVTGGGRGIGAAISRLLAAEGAAVAVNYRRDAEAAAATVDAITAAGGRAVAYQASVDDEAALATMVDAVFADFGFVDICVHNGGVASRGRTVAETDTDEYRRLLATHAIGPAALTRMLLPRMRAQERGDIVFMSSVATATFAGRGAPYNMGKAAMEALARTLVNEERDNGIHVNIVAPGLVETDMGVRLARAGGVDDLRSIDATSPFGRVCQPIDVARIVLFCVSDLGGYITGQRIQVDGGGQLKAY